MYWSVAEAVSGLKVFANGKWLTCIGNKPVRVGDRIWTDGRCVYGFLKEAQSPMVIVPPQREDWAVPIVIDRRAYVYTKEGLQELGEMTWIGSYYKSYKNISNNTTGKVCGININFDHLYDALFAINVNGANVYVLGARKGHLVIWKNDSVIKTGVSINASSTSKILRAFIEDENNWNLILGTSNDNSPKNISTIIGYVTDKELPGLTPAVQALFQIERVSDLTYRINLFDAFGSTPMYNSHYYNRTVSVDVVIQMEVREKVVEFQSQKNFSDKGLHNLKIPIHNGFYFVINSAWYWRSQFNVFSEPNEANISIFDPSGDLMLTSDCSFIPYITACKLPTGGYLMGVKYAHGGYASKLPAGLYLVKNKDEYKCLKAGDITNQKLEKMQSHKNWLDNLRRLEHP